MQNILKKLDLIDYIDNFSKLLAREKSIKECLDAVFPAIPYCIDLMEGPYLETKEDVIKAFRPKK